MTLSRTLITAMAATALLTGCDLFKSRTTEIEKEAEPIPWWEPLEPDVIIDGDEFYAGTCSITQVTRSGNEKTAKVIFKVPSRLFTRCTNSGRGEKPLDYDGEYIILRVCEFAIGAGGCGGESYRSADFENWEEHIGVTWINSEEYEAWRKVGSKSSKADSVKKVIRD
ncbi:hypothetical protein [Marinobacter sp. AC-23]|uniref:hypothetical protein n=1 Tax=Marinobacter sp. AC-23 TaxID=1879031 RepID=UPI0008DDAC86|nr:hypothetical protein [Marinobacter sp. AC-23]OHY82775.1 hypothetical protein BCA33_00725 [Marinobacter sp. AC-23]